MLKYLLVCLFAVLVIVECVGDMCFHRSIHNRDKNSQIYFYLGLGMSVLMGVLYYQILKAYDNLAVPNAIYQCLSVLAVTVVSLVVLKEKITMQKTLGIAVMIFGLGLIQFD
jgi:multidrug transporter EmrE-like cation transporter